MRAEGNNDFDISPFITLVQPDGRVSCIFLIVASRDSLILQILVPMSVGMGM